jgi:hypothetical protein
MILTLDRQEEEIVFAFLLFRSWKGITGTSQEISETAEWLAHGRAEAQEDEETREGNEREASGRSLLARIKSHVQSMTNEWPLSLLSLFGRWYGRHCDVQTAGWSFGKRNSLLRKKSMSLFDAVSGSRFWWARQATEWACGMPSSAGIAAIRTMICRGFTQDGFALWRGTNRIDCREESLKFTPQFKVFSFQLHHGMSHQERWMTGRGIHQGLNKVICIFSLATANLVGVKIHLETARV